MLRKKLRMIPEVTSVIKNDDHDRTRKGDFILTYKGKTITIEVKSVQSSSIKKTKGVIHGKVQCDASDKREIVLPDKSLVNTTCLLVGEFDILAICLFGFNGQWDYAFVHNHHLPRSRFRGYTALQRQYLLSTLIPISLPLLPPFQSDIVPLLEQLTTSVRQKRKR
jgi:hypothetical protein